ncbi:MAG: universal stress protein [Bacteroidota bacterium]
MKTLLVPIDYSDAAKNACHYAASLAAHFQAKMVLFHSYVLAPIVPPSDHYGVPSVEGVMLEQEEKRAQKYMADLLTELPDDMLSNIKVEMELGIGPASEEILEAAGKFNPDLIVMGMKGAGKLERALFGSTCAATLQQSPIPVLIIPENGSFKGFRSIAYATDYKKEDFVRLDWLNQFAEAFQAVVHGVHIRQENTQRELVAASAFKDHYKGEIMINEMEINTLSADNVVEGLNHYCQRHNVDLLSMLTHNRGFLGRMLVHSNTKEMAEETEVPLLVFRME